ncbi:hypothetical protein H8959_012461 [Pygathrix nigripes]
MGPALLALSFLWTMALTEDTCPQVKVVGLKGSDKLTILRGCPGAARSPRAKGRGRRRWKERCPWKEQGMAFIVVCHRENWNVPERPGSREVKMGEAIGGPRTCKDLLDRGPSLSGWHTIYLPDCRPLTMLCDMDTDGGGWTVSVGLRDPGQRRSAWETRSPDCTPGQRTHSGILYSPGRGQR